jgi:hypothetical protein
MTPQRLIEVDESLTEFVMRTGVGAGVETD